MEGADVLIGCAEIAVAFAGFASIVVLFQHRDPAHWPAYIVLRMRSMIEVSVAALVFALVPFVFYHAGAPPPLTWRLSSGALALVVTLIAARVFQRSRPLLGAGGLDPRFASGVAATTALAFALLLLNAIGYPFGPGFAAYLTGVLWLIVFAGLMFLRLVVLPRG